MIKNSIFWSIRTGIFAAATLSVVVALGCNSGDDDTPAAGAGGGGDGGGGGGDTATGNYNAPTNECAVVDPPMQDPYCFNTLCPNAVLPGLTDANKPMGDCCNTVDVKRREDGMAPGTTYDLEFALYINLPQSNPNVANDIIQGLVQASQLNGADITLMRFNDVPRTADMNGPVTVNMDIGTGKLNCDGSFSFYGANAAVEPIHEGPPNDPGRWKKSTIALQYNGFDDVDLVTHPSEDLIASTTELNWAPRWKATTLDYEQPLKFLNIFMDTNPNNWSCFGKMDSNGDWSLDGKLTAFVPVEEAKLTTLPDLGQQSQCGLFARGPYLGECDVAQSEWPTQPDSYCDDQYRCWLGVADNAEAAFFWGEFYEGEDNCGSAAHPCCDPTGADAALQPCNAYFSRGAIAVAAVEITDEDINDPTQSNSYKTNCGAAP